MILRKANVVGWPSLENVYVVLPNEHGKEETYQVTKIERLRDNWWTFYLRSLDGKELHTFPVHHEDYIQLG